MIEYLFIVTYAGGQMVAVIGPLPDVQMRECREIVARAAMENAGEPRRYEFNCEWHQSRPSPKKEK